MTTNNRAFFVRRPRVLSDLFTPHLIDYRSPYSVKKRINLRSIDYENLVTDMLVEREYIAESAELCADSSEVIDCLLISQSDCTDGILIVPGKNGCVRSAAILED